VLSGIESKQRILIFRHESREMKPINIQPGTYLGYWSTNDVSSSTTPVLLIISKDYSINLYVYGSPIHQDNEELFIEVVYGIITDHTNNNDYSVKLFDLYRIGISLGPSLKKCSLSARTHHRGSDER